MGFMTEIGILNDNFHVIEQDPAKFIQQIKVAMNRWKDDSYVMGQTTVHRSHHADEPRIYIAERNGFYDLGEYGIEDSLVENGTDDHSLDFYEGEIDKAVKMLKDSKKYVQYLRAEVVLSERPGGKDFSHALSSNHHIKAQRWRRKKDGSSVRAI